MKLIKWLLWPASILYGAGARLRAWTYEAGIRRQKRLNGSVVSIGNLTTGGTGKTPMVLWLAQRFMQNGERVGILSRGYRPLPKGGSVSGVEATPTFNDEMALIRGRLGESVEYGIGANRFRAGRQLEARGVDCFILDDGFQHLQLARDVNIAMIDSMLPFGGGHALPMGRLREPLSALARADIVVIHRCEKNSSEIEETVRRHTAAPMFYSQTELVGLKLWRSGTASDAGSNGRRFFAFCGIGNPSGFLADLKRWRIEVVGHRIFRDHHWYTAQDMASLEGSACKAGADSLVCTEKDIYDLPEDSAIGMPLYFCRIGMKFDDENGLWQSIVTRIERKTAVSKG